MSLSTRDSKALDEIDGRLAAADPQLAGKLSVFSRLADGEAMPVRERTTADKRRAPARDFLVLWLGISFALVVVALVMTHTTGGGTACASWPASGCGAHSGQHARAPSRAPGRQPAR